MLHRGPTSTAIASCSPRCSGTVSLRAESWHGVGRRVRPCRAAELADSLSAVVDHLPLALTPVGTPCAIAKCGDMVYRSTLDPNLYKQGGFDWRGALLLASVAGYLFLPPGVLPGFLDTYVLAPYLRARSKAVDKTDIALGKKLGTGGFGTVYKADLKENGEKVPIIVKKAKEFGEAEVWMNERLSRAPGNHVAKFITAFDDTAKPSNYSTPFDNAIWLLWYYEGDSTLAGLMEKKDFPYNMEEVLFGRELRLPKNELRKAATIKLAFKQLLEAVGACHNTGIVHRDIKPQNCILSTRDRKLKLIDLGAAADLRVGINYVPNEYLMDPRYAPPQQYIMSTQTPKPPPAPVAAFLSPVLWAMETPDRFDMFSCGMTLMQLVFPPLRSDNAILDFRAALQELDWDLDAWRRQKEAKLAAGALKPAVVAEWEEGFAILDADGGWELVRGLMTYKPSQRWSAARALAHPWITGNVVASQALGVAAAGSAALASAGQALSDLVGSDLVDEAITRSKSGAFTESQLLQELGLEDKAPKAPQASQTIAWWQERQAEFKRRAADKQAAAGTDGAKGAAAAAANSNGNGSSSKLKVPVILNVGAKKADSSAERAANGNANAKAPANANGKAPANNVKAPAAGKNGKAAPSAGAANSAPKKVFDLKGLFKRN